MNEEKALRRLFQKEEADDYLFEGNGYQGYLSHYETVMALQIRGERGEEAPEDKIAQKCLSLLTDMANRGKILASFEVPSWFVAHRLRRARKWSDLFGSGIAWLKGSVNVRTSSMLSYELTLVLIERHFLWKMGVDDICDPGAIIFKPFEFIMPSPQFARLMKRWDFPQTHLTIFQRKGNKLLIFTDSPWTKVRDIILREGEGICHLLATTNLHCSAKSYLEDLVGVLTTRFFGGVCPLCEGGAEAGSPPHKH